MPVLRLIARLPLRWFHAMGSLLGWLTYLSSKTYAQRLRENLFHSKVWSSEEEYEFLVKKCVAETGRGMLEIIPLWFRSSEKASRLIKRFVGMEDLIALRSAGRGVVLLTPHLGCFEIAAIGIAQQVPITVLYRKPKVRCLESFIVAGRARGQVKLASADLSGVRALYRALRHGEAIGILPDQAPAAGEGVWAGFFGRPAYTMTLVGRLIEATNAAVYMTYTRRLPDSAGFEVELSRIDEDLRGEAGVRTMNALVERTIRRCPEQYLWSYNRHKHPAGAPLPPK